MKKSSTSVIKVDESENTIGRISNFPLSSFSDKDVRMKEDRKREMEPTSWAPKSLGQVAHFMCSMSRQVIKTDESDLGTKSWLPGELSVLHEREPGRDDQSVLLPEIVDVWKKAKEQAEEILRATQKQAVEVLQQAKMDGLAAAEIETRQALQAAMKTLQEATQIRDAIIAGSENQVLEFVIAIARKIFGGGFDLEPGVLRDVFHSMFEETKSLGDLRIRLNPKDAESLGSQWLEEQGVLFGKCIEYCPDDDIERGGSFIEGKFGNVDARVNSQLEKIELTLSE